MATILVIDPSATVRETVATVLAGEHTVTTAASLTRGDALAAPPDVLVLGLAPSDDTASTDVLAGVPASTPLLLLHAHDTVSRRRRGDLGAGRRIELLSMPFDAARLRAAVRRLATPPARAVAHVEPAAHLAPPFLTPAATLAVQRALATDLPVLLAGEAGTGALDVARALHACAGSGGRCVVVAGRTFQIGSVASAAGGTLVVDGVEDVPPELQYALAALARGDASDGATVPRVIAVTRGTPATGTPPAGLVPELGWALAALVVPLVPLRDRLDDVPALAERVAAALAPRLGLAAPRFTEAACDRLRRYLWFGNLAELEAVVARTLAWHRPQLVDAADLAFAPSPPAAPARASTTSAQVDARPRMADPPAPGPGDRFTLPAEPRSAAPATTAAPTVPPPQPFLEVLLGELAHELRNPMSTIKTFAQHIESVLADPEVRTRFSDLTVEAVTRMDRVLETLLDFARFRAPTVRGLDLGTLVERVVAEYLEALAGRDVRVERNGTGPGPHPIRADEAQVLFALRQLFAGLLGDVVPHSTVRVGITVDGTLELGMRTERSTADRLAAFVEGAGGGGPETPPLYVALASALLQRNGGALGVRPGSDEGTTVMTVALPRGGGAPAAP